jgi:hypothetical protein
VEIVKMTSFFINKFSGHINAFSGPEIFTGYFKRN